jgi:putative hydrolase of the HAD superfamily
MKLVFDVDNTLYSFDDTGFGDVLNRRILEYMVTKLGFSHADAQRRSQEYYIRYGLTAHGLHKDFGVDLNDYCAFVNQCDYSRLRPDPGLSAALEGLNDEGHELWFMTNADMAHAVNVLEALGVAKLFRRPTATGANGELCQWNGFDCFQQWDFSEPKMQNKPMVGAYEALIAYMSEQSNEVAMIEDSLINLEAPHRLGWKTVWISHGRSLPRDSQFLPDITVRSISDLPYAFAQLGISSSGSKTLKG